MLAALVVGCGRADDGARRSGGDRENRQTTTDGCPDTSRPDPARLRRVLARLSGVATTASFPARIEAAGVVLCSGPEPTERTAGNPLVVDSLRSDEEAAARVVHALVHVEAARGPGRDAPVDCAVAATELVAEEARALDAELTVREALGAWRHGVDVAVRAAWAAADPEDRLDVLVEWLEAAPDNAAGVDVDVPAFVARCEQGRRERAERLEPRRPAR